MNKKSNRKGSYLVEAALTIPIFILAVFMLISSIPVISTVENVIFATADEMRMESVKSMWRESPYILPVVLEGRIVSENQRIEKASITAFPYLYSNEQFDDLITVNLHLTCKGDDPFDFFSYASFDGKITARAFTGTLHKNAPGSGDNSEVVCIFPEWGNRYHKLECTYVKENCQMIYLSQTIIKKYKACQVCQAQSAQIGNPVCVFTQYGEAYHVPKCRLVERYYLQIEKSKAIAQGYSPCSKCGG